MDSLRFYRIGCRGFHVEKVFELGAGRENLVDEGTELIKATNEQTGKADERHDLTNLHLTLHDEMGAEGQNHEDGYCGCHAIDTGGQGPPVQYRVLRGKQLLCVGLQGARFFIDAIIALQDGDIAHRVGNVAEGRNVMALDLRLTVLGLRCHKAANQDVNDTQNRQYRSQTPVLHQSHRNKADEGHCGREVSAHEFEPQAKQSLDRAQKRMHRIGCATLVMPRKRHADHAIVRLGEDGKFAPVREAIGLPRNQDIRADMEQANCGQLSKGKPYVGLVGNCLDDEAHK